MSRARGWHCLPVLLAVLGAARVQSARCPFTRPAFCNAESNQYRTFDGSCNNQVDTTMGKSNTPLLRVLEPNYANGIHSPRRTNSNQILPSARRIVTTLLQDRDVPSKVSNIMVMTWAQLVSHDVSRIQASFPRPNSACCAVTNTTDSCDRIPVPADDSFYSRFGVRCIGVDRSASAPCRTAAHEQTNLVTHWLDASFVYGSDQHVALHLRERRGGRLRTQFIQADEFLPRGANGGMEAGDGRVTITPMLAALQTLFMREHNRVARRLASVNLDWSDEELFQEARRIVIAEWQLLTYRDWLQWLIGTDVVQKEGLLPSLRLGSADYDHTVDATTANDFTSGAYRSFHSMIANDVWFTDGKDSRPERRLLSDVTADAILHPVSFKRTVLGLVYQPRQRQDQFIAEEITNKMFRGRNAFGSDLMSVDIQRGREHGLPSYNEYREHCRLRRAESFDDFNDTISAENIALLRKVYDNHDDVDFLVGGLLEQIDDRNPLATITSPTFRCVIVQQFKRWKRGDRFFFDLNKREFGFSPAQLQELRKVTMSRLICDNTPGVTTIPDDVFLNLGVLGNHEVSCRDLPSMDLRAWRGRPPKSG
ncbi:peroxidase-like [Frankliniella occidentalis]|uniref:Peroxidase-like n=1 Tax=Frankliniella occidentalis TaxID=133901 RepID=A0A6J1TPT9_FRAOC|nr:peroxidase-like [Frankliniella occidentalis]